MQRNIRLKINEREFNVTTDTERPLLEVLREDLQLTGTKYACGEGKCGTCTVLVEGKTVMACETPVGQVEGKAILTIEGLAKGEQLHPVQQAFLDEGGFQCGYCSPGMILATVALLQDKPRPTEADIRARFEGHICRCCGYPKILKAIRRAASLSRS